MGIVVLSLCFLGICCSSIFSNSNVHGHGHFRSIIMHLLFASPILFNLILLVPLLEVLETHFLPFLLIDHAGTIDAFFPFSLSLFS